MSVNTDKLMKALTIQAHMAAWERKTRRFGASPQQTSNFIQALQSDLDTSDDQKSKMKAMLTEIMKEMLVSGTDEIKKDDKPSNEPTILELQEEIKLLQAKVK